MLRQILLSFLFSLTGLILIQDACLAQSSRSGLVSPSTARRFGLKRAWHTQIELDRARERIAFVTMHVSNSDFLLVKEVVYDGGKLSYSERDLDQLGDPIGREGATNLAETQVQRFRDDDVKAKVNTLEIPAVTLYFQTDAGSLHAVDGETGRTLWSVTLGRPDHPTLKPGASDEYVAVVNGSNLLLLNAADGSLKWRKSLGGAPGAGPAVNKSRVFCPLVNGRVETYRTENAAKPPWIYQSSGRAMIQPTVSPKTISWATDRGTFYVAYATRDIIRYRLQALDTILAPSTFMPNRLFVASVDGNVYAMHEYSGDMEWRFTVGDPISHPPIVVDDAVYVVAERGGMYRVSAETGQEQWWTPQIRQFVAASKNRIFCISDAGRLLIIDRNTGGRIGAIATEGLDLNLINWRTDRIFVGTRYGVIQCLHDVEQPWPLLHVAGEAPEEEADKPEIKQKGLDEGDGREEPDDKDPFKPKEDEDPFGGGGDEKDPFGGDADDEKDPFGGDDAGDEKDPSGGDDAGDEEDPFGGDAGDEKDPFG